MRVFLLSIAALSLVMACSNASVGQAAEEGAQMHGESAAAQHSLQQSTAQPPTPGAVLNAIYGVEGDGSSTYEVDNGSVATYWFGHEYLLQGRRYFTGFAYNTPEKYGASVEEEFPDPAEKVDLTQATFEMADSGAETPWTLRGTQLNGVGEFGAYARGEGSDDARTVESWSEGGRLLLAVPTVWFEQGVNSRRYALLLLTLTDDNAGESNSSPWKYLGSIETGSDNGANCADDAASCHYSNNGVLTFADAQAGGFPVINIARSGTKVLEDGNIAEIAPGSVDVYRFDAAQGGYVQ